MTKIIIALFTLAALPVGAMDSNPGAGALQSEWRRGIDVDKTLGQARQAFQALKTVDDTCRISMMSAASEALTQYKRLTSLRCSEMMFLLDELDHFWEKNSDYKKNFYPDNHAFAWTLGRLQRFLKYVQHDPDWLRDIAITKSQAFEFCGCLLEKAADYVAFLWALHSGKKSQEYCKYLDAQRSDLEKNIAIFNSVTVAEMLA